MTTHPIHEEELMAYLDGELPAERAAMVTAHIGQCRECQALAADLQSVSRQLLEWQIDPPQFAMSQPLVSALQETEAAKEPVSRKTFSLLRAPGWMWPVGAAAVLVLVGLMVRLSDSPQYLRMSKPARYEGLQQHMEMQRSTRSSGKADVMAMPSEAPVAAPRANEPSEPSGPLI